MTEEHRGRPHLFFSLPDVVIENHRDVDELVDEVTRDDLLEQDRIGRMNQEQLFDAILKGEVNDA